MLNASIAICTAITMNFLLRSTNYFRVIYRANIVHLDIQFVNSHARDSPVLFRNVRFAILENVCNDCKGG